MKSIITVVGARPQFIKAAMVSRALRLVGIEEQIVHTGQHYDHNLSDVFFDELGLSSPATNLDVGSGTHAEQTGMMMVRLEEYLLNIPKPDAVLVYGDTNSTLAAAVTAKKLLLPLAHVEAGLRSFNAEMPEEINRIITDRLADFLFCPTETSVKNLITEGISAGVHLTGDVMYDASSYYSRPEMEPEMSVPLSSTPYVLATVHRAENTDNPDRFAQIIRGLGMLSIPVLFPVHPRSEARLKGLALPDNINLCEPLSYRTMMQAVKRAHRVVTDSGGLQKEAVWLDTPCITLRDETEWTESLENGWNILVGANAERLSEAMSREPTGPAPLLGHIPESSASETIATILAEA